MWDVQLRNKTPVFTRMRKINFVYQFHKVNKEISVEIFDFRVFDLLFILGWIVTDWQSGIADATGFKSVTAFFPEEDVSDSNGTQSSTVLNFFSFNLT